MTAPTSPQPIAAPLSIAPTLVHTEKEKGGSSPKASWKDLRRFYKYVAPYKLRFFSALVAVSISTSMGLVFPYLAGHLIDSALPGQHQVQLPWWLANVNTIAILLIFSLALQAVFSFYQIYWFNQVGEQSLADLRADFYSRIISLPMTFFGQRRVGELTSRISSDVTVIHDTLIGSVPQFLRQTMLLLGGLILIAVTSWKLTLVMLSSFPVLVLVAVLVGRKIRTFSREGQDRLALSATVVEETLQGIANVKAFGNERYEQQRYEAQLHGLLDTLLKAAQWRAGLVSFIIFGLFGAIVLVLWYGALQMQAGLLSVGELTRFILYTTFVGGAVASFADVIGQIQKTLGATERVFELMDEKPESEELSFIRSPRETFASPILSPNHDKLSLSAPTAIEKGSGAAAIRGDVEFRDVWFSYPSRPDVQVLRGLNVVARAGENIALVGASGAGKSTAVSLILRFFDPQRGHIFIDGRSASEYRISDLRQHMAIVPQEVLLFGGSIRDNIAYGKPSASESEIIEASHLAFCHEFIEELPEKYETLVGERGVKLSGGQRQRVAIARALLKNPSILILDEATSALDSENERLVQQALAKLITGRTTFIIAHRLSTVRRVDRIYVLDHGEVQESGTHEELMSQESGSYRKFSELQFGLV